MGEGSAFDRIHWGHVGYVGGGGGTWGKGTWGGGGENVKGGYIVWGTWGVCSGGRWSTWKGAVGWWNEVGKHNYLKFFRKQKRFRAREIGKSWKCRKIEQKLNKNQIISKPNSTQNYVNAKSNARLCKIYAQKRQYYAKRDVTVWFVKSAVPKKTRFCGIGVEEATSKEKVSASSPIPRVLRVNFI